MPNKLDRPIYAHFENRSCALDVLLNSAKLTKLEWWTAIATILIT